MIKFPVAVPAKKPKTKESQTIIYTYAATLTVLVLCQLFTFDKFLPLLETFNFPGGFVTAHLVGSLVVVSEVFAIPFLLRLKLSPLMRIMSMVFSWLVPLIWFMTALWLIFATKSVLNIGLLGTLVNLTPGWWAVFMSVALGVMAGWSSWGLWPFAKRVSN